MKYDSDFTEEVIEGNMEDPLEILNWYRNLYYKEGNHTEHGIMAEAINDLFMKYKDAFRGSNMAKTISLDEVVEDMCFHEVGWIQDAAAAYFHKEYLHENYVENPNREWWQFWKPKYIWTKQCNN